MNFEQEYIAARRDYIAGHFRHLNEMQRTAVLATQGPLLILAGAGSGKTTVLINRIANLIQFGCGSDSMFVPEDVGERELALLKSSAPEAETLAAVEPVAPWRILAITFTNKAAGELKDRLENMLGETARDIWACTFHSACVRILRRDAESVGYSSNFTIYDTNDSLSIIKKIIKDLEVDEKVFAPKAVLGEISRSKDRMISSRDYESQAISDGDLRRRTIGKIYSEYTRRLFSSDAMDFDDLIFLTVRLLQDHEEVRDYWQRRFRYVLVDEYQDTNHMQYLLTSLLAGKSGNICVVGDDDQSIYKFRGANIENILSFEKEFKNCRTIRLEQNYRSTERILDAANAVIRNNSERKGKELWTANEQGEKIDLYVAENEGDEAAHVASVIFRNFRNGANWKEHAVLYRMNAQSNQFEYAFKRQGIPYRIIGGTGFFERSEVKDILAYLTVIATPEDDLRLLRILNVPARGIGKTSEAAAEAIAAREGKTLFEVLLHAGDYPELKRASGKMQQFAEMIVCLQKFAEGNTTELVFDELIEKTGYIAALQEKNTQEDQNRIENVQEVRTSIMAFMKESGDLSIPGYLANVSLYTDLDSLDDENNAVLLMTMHSAKGLEFPTVFMVGLEETVFPGLRAIGEPADMEEERRLCYVAMTRAEKQLNLVCARIRTIFGRTNANRVSRFVDEIPEELIRKNVPKGFSYRDSSRQEAYRRPVAPVAAAGKRIAPVGNSAAAMPDLNVGDHVNHKAFGAGVIVEKKPMGGDFLISIDFKTVGKKKLMLRAAGQYMTKEDM